MEPSRIVCPQCKGTGSHPPPTRQICKRCKGERTVPAEQLELSFFLECAKEGCANTDPTKFMHVEDAQATRSIAGFNAAGVLQIDGHYDMHPGGGNEWLECQACATKRPVPEEVDYT